ncbi:sigma-70 family RNA polymerase sigma factor [Micromonospora sp. CB01531]|uniref:sigma-70 family RNA polymerase sigma factor n=1 Tax=Micromonospora sp. CB01531 TaxID=1718947 RepID=UPI00093AAC31|nr:sigma-70 family RNA polymerase sigma factor [Micromonospora sp. CB01531]OKI54562.1 hypothetical protein A6A27_32055 [Micromonospora sp. CB01531]
MEMSERLSSLHGYVSFLARQYAKQDDHLQQDFYQDAMEGMWRELLKAQEEGRSLNDSFLLQKARWVMVDKIRKGKWESAVDPQQDEHLLDRPVTEDPQVYQDEIKQAVASLGSRQREYVYLRFWKGYNTAELRKLGFGNSLWYGSQRTPGVRTLLGCDLAHLAPSV